MYTRRHVKGDDARRGGKQGRHFNSEIVERSTRLSMFHTDQSDLPSFVFKCFLPLRIIEGPFRGARAERSKPHRYVTHCVGNGWESGFPVPALAEGTKRLVWPDRRVL